MKSSKTDGSDIWICIIFEMLLVFIFINSIGLESVKGVTKNFIIALSSTNVFIWSIFSFLKIKQYYDEH
jgi:hypothetical protein